MKKIILSTIILVLIIATSGYYYVFIYSKNKKFDMEHADSMNIEATALVSAFQENEANANKLYLDKVLFINGVVGATAKTQSGETSVTLTSSDPFSGVMATLDSTVTTQVKVGDTIAIKGFCKGFLSDVVITNALIQ